VIKTRGEEAEQGVHCGCPPAGWAMHRAAGPVSAENLRHLGRCFAGCRRLGHVNGAWRAGLVRAGVG
jgi:hypothetical protein